DDVAAAVDVDDDRQLRRRIGRGLGAPDVEVEAVLGADLLVERLPDRAVVLVLRRRAEEAADLGAGIGEVLRRAGVGPCVGRLRRLPAQRADGRLGKRYAAPRDGVAVALEDAVDLA